MPQSCQDSDTYIFLCVMHVHVCVWINEDTYTCAHTYGYKCMYVDIILMLLNETSLALSLDWSSTG